MGTVSRVQKPRVQKTDTVRAYSKEFGVTPRQVRIEVNQIKQEKSGKGNPDDLRGDLLITQHPHQ